MFSVSFTVAPPLFATRLTNYFWSVSFFSVSSIAVILILGLSGPLDFLCFHGSTLALLMTSVWSVVQSDTEECTRDSDGADVFLAWEYNIVLIPVAWSGMTPECSVVVLDKEKFNSYAHVVVGMESEHSLAVTADFPKAVMTQTCLPWVIFKSYACI